MSGPHPSHVTRSSDASTFDEICVNCGATDQVPGGWGKLASPCPKVPKSAVDELAKVARRPLTSGEGLIELLVGAGVTDADVGRFVRELAAEADQEGLRLVVTTAPKGTSDAEDQKP